MEYWLAAALLVCLVLVILFTRALTQQERNLREHGLDE